MEGVKCMSNITKIISKNIEGVAQNKASKCAFFIYQPKVPKNLLKAKKNNK